jgi:hypothetical protein
MRLSLWREFMRLEAAGRFLLLAAAILALILANTPLAWLYHGLRHRRHHPGGRPQGSQAAPAADQRRAPEGQGIATSGTALWLE